MTTTNFAEVQTPKGPRTLDATKRADTALYLAVDEVRSLRADLKRDAEFIKRLMDETIARLDEGYTLNSLGVLQSTGLKLDVNAAKLSVAEKALLWLLSIHDDGAA